MTNTVELAPILLEVLQGVKVAGFEVYSQAPAIVNEFLRYHFWSGIFYIVLSFAALFYCFSLGKKAFSKLGEHEDADNGFLACLILVVCCMGGLFCVFAIIFNMIDIIKIVLAPRVYMIDWVAQSLSK
jgi:hypothetical protein